MMRMLLITSILLVSGCSYIPYLGKLPPDNFVEEGIEKGIEELFDMPDGSIDLSVLSPE